MANKTIKELEKERAVLKAAGRALLQQIKIKEADGNTAEAEVSLTDLQKIKVKLDEVSDDIQTLIKEEFNTPDDDDDEAEDKSSEEDTSPEKAFSAPVVKGTSMNKKTFNINSKYGNFKDYSAKGEEFGRQALAQHMAKSYGAQEAHSWAKNHFGDEQMMSKLVSKATGANTVAGSGVQPADYSKEVIELLYAQGKLLPYLKVEQLPFGNKGWFRHRLGATASNVLEGGSLPVTQNAWDLVPITWKKYGAKTYATKEMVEFTPLEVVNTIVDNLARECALYKESRLFFGQGGTNDFTGILTGVNPANVFNSSTNGTTYTTQTMANDLEQTTLKLAQNLVDLDGVIHFSSFGVSSFLRQYRTGPGYSENIAFPEINEHSSWNGRPIIQSNLIPAVTGTLAVSGSFTATGSLTMSPFITLQPRHIRVAEAMGTFRIDSTDIGSFMDGGTQVNTWDTDMIAFKATGYAESMLEHDVSASVLITNGWSLNQLAALHTYLQAANTGTVPVSGTPSGTL
jgi:HK97 family phage major capsid protein